MAAIGKIRSWGPWLVGIIGLALFGFIATDFTRSCETSSNQARQQVGEVMGEKLSIQDFQSEVEEFKNVYKMIGRDVDEDWLREMVWNNHVQNSIIEEEAKKLGLGVTDNEMKVVLASGIHPLLQRDARGNSALPLHPAFFDPQTGLFDYNRVAQLYTNIQQQSPSEYDEFDRYWKTVEKLLRQQLLTEKYLSLLQACMLSNEASARIAFDGANNQSDIKLASLYFSSINDNDIQIDDKDLKAKYDEKKSMFRWDKETRDIRYAVCSVVPSETDMENLRNNLADAADQLRRDSLSIAEIQSSHLSTTTYRDGLPYNAAGLRRLSPAVVTMLDSMADGTVSDQFTYFTQKGSRRVETMAVARLNRRYQGVDSIGYKFIQVPGLTPEDEAQRADSLLAVIKGGESIDSVGAKLGQPTVEVWFNADDYQNEESVMPLQKSLYDLLHNATVGEPQLFAVNGTSNIIVVTGRRSATLYDVVIVSNDVAPTNDTYENVYNQFSQYVSECSTPEDLQKNAEKYGYQVIDQTNLQSNATRIGTPQAIDGTREAVKWAFNDAKEGSISPNIYRNDADGRYVAVAVTKIHPVGYLDQQSVEDFLRQEVLKDKKAEMLMKQLEGVTTVEQAEQRGAVVDTLIPRITFPIPVSVRNQRESGLSGAVAATAVGQTVKKPVRGTTGVFLFTVLDRTAKAGAEFDRRQEEAGLIRNALFAVTPQQYNPYTSVFDVLVEKADVKDNRVQF